VRSDPQTDQRLLASLFGTLKLMQMYGREHDATADALANLASGIEESAHGDFAISLRGNRLQVNGNAMRSADCGSLALSYLSDALKQRGIGSFHIVPGCELKELTRFFELFLEADTGRSASSEALVKAMEANKVGRVVVEARETEEGEPTVLEERRDSAMRSYVTGLRAFKEVLRFGSAGNRAKVRRARRAVHGLVDRFLEDEAAVLALAQIRGFDQKLFNHSLNVCIYALALGQRLGMARRQLGELGMAALFHDLGKTVADSDPDEASQSRAATQWRQLRAHPARGARLLLDAGSTHEGMLKSAITAYEHHAQHDRRGFPNLDHQPHLFARIIAIADCYEALTATSSYRETPYAAHDAYNLMYAKSGSLFDPLLLKVFVNALGLYPVGSLVELNSGEVAVVTEGPVDPANFKLPRVRIVDSAKGHLRPDTQLDLDEREDGTGRPLRTVVRVLPPHEVFEDVGELVSAI
jgi:HD-GYP domain-containing protein (c-di-GMP phosphodiesterase class II)